MEGKQKVTVRFHATAGTGTATVSISEWCGEGRHQ